MRYLLLIYLNMTYLLGDGMPSEATKPIDEGISWITGPIFISVLTLALIFVGYQYITGNEEKAKNYLKNILIGGIIILVAGSIAQFFT